MTVVQVPSLDSKAFWPGCNVSGGVQTVQSWAMLSRLEQATVGVLVPPDGPLPLSPEPLEVVPPPPVPGLEIVPPDPDVISPPPRPGRVAAAGAGEVGLLSERKLIAGLAALPPPADVLEVLGVVKLSFGSFDWFSD